LMALENQLGFSTQLSRISFATIRNDQERHLNGLLSHFVILFLILFFEFSRRFELRLFSFSRFALDLYCRNNAPRSAPRPYSIESVAR
jgi:hypothetical protein